MKKSLVLALSFFSKVGLATAIPAVSLGLAGKYLDKIFSTTPWLTIAGLTLAFFLTFIILKRLSNEAIKILKDNQ
jgi:F0F1-type ATP synthase assembly protein I